MCEGGGVQVEARGVQQLRGPVPGDPAQHRGVRGAEVRGVPEEELEQADGSPLGESPSSSRGLFRDCSVLSSLKQRQKFCSNH